MRIHDSGSDVSALQRALVKAGHNIAADGEFGPATDKAVRAFQRSVGLVADGIVGPKTQVALGGGHDERLLKQDDLERAAAELDVELPAIMAVNEVESRGSGFLPDGRPVILFERHVMRRRLAHHGMDTEHWEARYPNIVNARTGGYEGGADEWPRLGLAWSIHSDAAIESASWGLFQIMGFHWEALGYDHATDYQAAMRESEGAQLDAFVRFIRADRHLHRALKRLNWQDFARRYNGPAYAKNNYDNRMQAAYDRHSAALEAS